MDGSGDIREVGCDTSAVLSRNLWFPLKGLSWSLWSCGI